MGRYRSLEDFFVAGEATINGHFDDGWAPMPLIGREIEATVLVVRPQRIPGRAANLGPAETLLLLNQFLARVADEPLERSFGILGECGGGRLTVLFSTEFGGADPFGEALALARQLVEQDLDFAPRFGLASGEAIVGYLGTPLNYSCAAVGRPLDLAGRCADCEPPRKRPEAHASAITFPQADWEGREFEVAFPPRRRRQADGSLREWRFPWRLEAAREIEVPESSPLLVRQLIASLPGPDSYAATPEEQVRAAVEHLRRSA